MDYPKTQPNVALLDGKFTDGDPTVPIQPSRDPASWGNDVTDSILNVQTDGGLAPQEGDPTQLQKALKRRFGGNVTTLAATGALTDDMAGLVLVDAAAAAIVLTLPPAADGPWPFQFVRTDNVVANTVTIAAAAGDTIGAAASIGLPAQNSARSLRSDAVHAWHEPMQAGSDFAVDTGAANAYVAAFDPPLTTHVVGKALRIQFTHTNVAGACTVNPGPGVVALVTRRGTAPPAGMIQANVIGTVTYDGARYVLSGVSYFFGDHTAFVEIDESGMIWQGGQVVDGADTSGAVDFTLPFPNAILDWSVDNLSSSEVDAIKYMAQGAYGGTGTSTNQTQLYWYSNSAASGGTAAAPNTFKWWARGY